MSSNSGSPYENTRSRSEMGEKQTLQREIHDDDGNNLSASLTELPSMNDKKSAPHSQHLADVMAKSRQTKQEREKEMDSSLKSLVN